MASGGPPEPIELDVKRYEVRIRGTALRLERHPMELLLMLLERPGELVTRDAIARRLWGEDVFVDADQGINTAVNKIRRALGNDPGDPSFVQTVIGKGYRFVGPVVNAIDEATAGPEPTAPPSCGCAVTWEGRTIALAEGLNILGRDASAAIRIDSSTVSRWHAQIVVSGPTVTIADLGSKNATRVNGQKVDAPMPLADYDVIQIGSATLIFRLPSRTGSTLTVPER